MRKGRRNWPRFIQVEWHQPSPNINVEARREFHGSHENEDEVNAGCCRHKHCIKQTGIEPFDAELDRWFQTVPLDPESDPLQYWKLSSDFPRMKFMARSYLACPATSVPSEQAFSKAGDTVTKKRNRLGDNSLQCVMVLQSWLKHLPF